MADDRGDMMRALVRPAPSLPPRCPPLARATASFALLVTTLLAGACATGPKTTAPSGKLLVTNVPDGVSCFAVTVLRRGFPPDAEVQLTPSNGQAEVPLDTASDGVAVMRVELNVDTTCTELEDRVGTFAYDETFEIAPAQTKDIPFPSFLPQL